LFERDQRFDLGLAFDWRDPAACDPLRADEALAARGIGIWQCDLRNGDALSWSDGVYDLFGLPRGAQVSRAETVALYAEGSRAVMERLRAYALRHRRGFTLDAQIIPAQGDRRWMRLVAAPVCVNSRPVRLQGYKQDVTHLYR
jgi:PAS domain-containing protein